MDKEDVIYGKEEKVKPNAVDWTKIVNLTKPVPLENLSAAKKACEEAAKDPGMANAYVKVGMIKDDLYLRVKLKTGAFKKNIKEDTLLAKGYRNIKKAQEVEKEKDKEEEVKKKEKLEESQKILQKTPSQSSQEGQYGKRMETEFDSVLANEVVAKIKDIVDKIKACGDALSKKPVPRDKAVQAKMNQAGLSPLITGLEKGLKQLDDLMKNNPSLLRRKPDVDKCRHAERLREQSNLLAVKVKEAIDAARQQAVVTEEYRLAREGVINDYRKVINDIKALQPRANGLLAPAKSATGFEAIKQEFDKIALLREEAVTAFSPTREGSEITKRARTTLSKEDIVDYLFDLTTEAKEANLAVSQGIRAALAALQGKLEPMVTTTPGAKELLEKVVSGQRGFNN